MDRRQAGRPGSFAPSWLARQPVERHFWQRMPVGPDPDLLWSRMALARTLIAAALFLLQALLWRQGSMPAWTAAAALVYLVTTLAGMQWGRPQASATYWSAQWALTLWVDLAMFATLQLTRSASIDYAPLFLLPVLWAAALGPLALALGSAAFATLVLLGQAAHQWLAGPDLSGPTFLQGALTGSGLFLVALLASQLAQRLARERALAQDSQTEARLQSEVNDLIVGGLQEGVLVLDEDGDIWHANPAAISMLGLGHSQPDSGDLTDTPAGAQLLAWTRQGLRAGGAVADRLSVSHPGGHSRTLQVRMHPTTKVSNAGPRVAVLFLEDQREIEARIRNEKLAAMGRLSAAVAHEIRNPLAAVSQANALLAEEDLLPSQQRLSAMIGQNVRRIARTVDDILELARGPAPMPPDADGLPALDLWVQDIVGEWQQGIAQRTTGHPWRVRAGTGAIKVRFDPEHLRRVLVNLLDNARKHGRAADSADEAVVLTSVQPGHRAMLTVWSPGPELTAPMRQQLFEPFSSTDSRSSGLGLYICRELCHRYGAQIDYQRMTLDHHTGNAFTVLMHCLPPDTPLP